MHCAASVARCGASGASRSPYLAFDELHGVPGRIAHVDRAAAQRPRDLALDLEARCSEVLAERIEAAVADPERDVTLAGRAVRRDEAPRRRAARRVEQQEQPSVLHPERRRALVRWVDRPQSDDIAVERHARLDVVRVENRLVYAGGPCCAAHGAMIAAGLSRLRTGARR